MKTMITNSWNVYLLSYGSILADGLKVDAPRIGLCSNNVAIKRSRLDSNYRGCPADKGIGNLQRLKDCAGAGGSHGGAGGPGATES